MEIGFSGMALRVRRARSICQQRVSRRCIQEIFDFSRGSRFFYFFSFLFLFCCCCGKLSTMVKALKPLGREYAFSSVYDACDMRVSLYPAFADPFLSRR
jgi:hypothetical protein